MDSKFAIFDLGFTGNMAKPVAVALAVCGGITAPTATIEIPAQIPDRSEPGTSPVNSLTMPVAGPNRQAIAAHFPSRSSAAVTLQAPTVTASLADPILQAHASSGSKSLLRQGSAFASGFAEMPDPEAPPALVEQVLNPEPTKDLLPPAKAEDTVATPVTAQLSPPMDLAKDQTMKLADLTAFDPAAKPAESLVQPKPEAPAATSPVAPAIAFVAVPVVQPLGSSGNEPAALVDAAPAKAVKPAPQAVSAPTMAKPKPETKSAAPAAARLPGVETLAFSIDKRPEVKATAAPKVVSRLAKKPEASGKAAYLLKGDVIDFALPARLNGESVGTIPLRVTRDDRLWVRLGDLLTMVRSQMNPDQFELLSASAAANEYMDFEAVRRAGIALHYDAARNRIDLGQM